jgi:hypothetical protein
MIDTRIYQLQAELPSLVQNKDGRQDIEWMTVYVQTTKDNFEYSRDLKRALKGDFDDIIPKCTVNYIKDGDDLVVKLEQKVKKDQQPRILFIRQDEATPNDFEIVCNLIRENSMEVKGIGRPILVNSHTGRGVSALSRNSDNRSFRGIVNILIILLVISNAQNIYRMINEEGWVMGSSLYNLVTGESTWKLENIKYLLVVQHMVTSPIITFVIEKYLAPNKSVPRIVVFALIVANLVHVIVYPVWIGHRLELYAIARMYILLFTCMWLLKFISYHHIWHDIRYHVLLANNPEKENKDLKEESKELKKDSKEAKEAKKNDVKVNLNTSLTVDPKLDLETLADKLKLPQPIAKSVLSYPNNVVFKDVLVFLLIPTLCFQLKYPFKENTSILKFLRRLAEYIVIMVLWCIIMVEYVTPVVLDCGKAIKQEDYYNALFHFIRLAVPNTYSWLLMFYGTFHVYLNGFAELTGFADRNFYDDWWNSTTLGEYWKKWNLPVHCWLVRHIYFPLIRRGYSRSVCMVLVFGFSAILHEYLVLGIIGYVSLIGFSSIMMQFPFILLQEKYKKALGGNVGNITFWLTF